MTDPQFQPAQDDTNTTTSVQGGGVFGGGEDIFADSSVFQNEATPPQSQEPEITLDHSVFSEPEDGSSLAIDTPEKIQEPVSTPVVEEAKEEVEESKEEIVKEETPVVQQIVQEETKQEITDKPVSDVRKKFDELSSNVSVVMKYLHLGSEDLVDVVGADNDKLTTLYQFGINDTQDVIIKKIETDKETEDSSFNELRFGLDPDTDMLQITLDDVLLYDEDELLEDAKKKSQVIEKLNKLIFLTGEQRKDIEKEAKAKEEEEKERRRLQDIFRNF